MFPYLNGALIFAKITSNAHITYCMDLKKTVYFSVSCTIILLRIVKSRYRQFKDKRDNFRTCSASLKSLNRCLTVSRRLSIRKGTRELLARKSVSWKRSCPLSTRGNKAQKKWTAKKQLNLRSQIVIWAKNPSGVKLKTCFHSSRSCMIRYRWDL